MAAVPAPVETAEERRRKQMDGVPDLPPLLAQILAETRAKQARAKERAEKGLPPEEEEEKAKKAGKPGGPLMLEAPPSAHLVYATHDAPIPKEPSDSEADSEAEAEAQAPPGPPDASRCRAHGPGFSGAAAGQLVKLTITARDAAGKRVREGGAHILVMVEPVAPPGASGDEPEPIQAEVEDHNNGSYTASYTVPNKGNYQLHIEVNGEPLGGSPFPIFFSAPVAPPPAPPGALPPPPPMPPAGQAAVAGAPGMAVPLPSMTAGGIQVVTADAIKAASQQAAAVAGTALVGALAGAEAAATGVGYSVAIQNSLGVKMAQVGMKFPATLTEEQGNRLVVVGGVPAIATAEAVKSVFAFCGNIRSCTLAGAGTGFAFLEFSAPHEAAAALAMNGTPLMGHALQLELATEAKKAAEHATLQAQMNNPYAALQLQQVQQFQLLHQQQTALAEQVAAMRAAQRTGVVLPPPAPKPHDKDSQKSAAMAAVLALSKRFAGGGAAAAAAAPEAAANGGERRRSRSRSRSKSRDRSRRERRRSRSRDRSRRERRDSRERRTRRSRSRERRDRDRERRDGSRDRRSRRSRSRSREHRHKHKHRHHKSDRKERRRSHSRDRGRERSAKGDKEEAAGAGAEAQQQQKRGEKMEWEAGDAPAAQAKPKEEEDLEALLDELSD